MLQDQPKILALDDDVGFLKELKAALCVHFAIKTVSSISEAMQSISQYRPDILLLDMNMPDVTGLQFLKVVRQRVPELSVLMLTGDTRTEMIVNAIKSGACDYVVKGTEDFFENLKIRIHKALQLNGIKKQNEVLSSRLREELRRYEILGISPSTIRLRADLTKFKGTDAYVLILGKNGTGKELVARNLNLQEEDPARPFCAVNCGAIPPHLFESELFGHVKGAFTGAIVEHTGKFVSANGGDIFLDEIGELPLEMQVKLLRVLQEKYVTPVGSSKSIKVNVRVIAATNRRLEDLIEQGKFREDLFFRLNQITVTTAALRDRPEDIMYLANMFAQKSLPGITFSKEAIKVLEEHPWPGNIRELVNSIERACIFVRGTVASKISPEHLMLANLKSSSRISIPSWLMPKNSEDVSKKNYQQCMDWMQKTYFDLGLKLMDGSNADLIEALKISRSVYYDRKKELEISYNQDSGYH